MKNFKIQWQLLAYDAAILLGLDVILLMVFPTSDVMTSVGLACHMAMTALVIFGCRILGGVYQQVWRFGGVQSYIRLMIFDGIACILCQALEYLLPERISYVRLLSLCCLNLLTALAMRMAYRYAYKSANTATTMGKIMGWLLKVFAPNKVDMKQENRSNKIKVAIIGAGSVGTSLCRELLTNTHSPYAPRCFVDVDRDKVGRNIDGLPVLLETEATIEQLAELEIQEVVFAVPHLDRLPLKKLYDTYTNAGYKVKVYGLPLLSITGGNGRPAIREFDIQELLFRKPVVLDNTKAIAYYQNKVILVTGGGGSIGSEICKQLAIMRPAKIVVLDICENGAYDVQQDIRIAFNGEVKLDIEIASISNYRAMDRVFAAHRPQIVIHAAAHKHVPLMEHNCVEAVENNVFGTKNLVDLCEAYGVERFMMVSTDKAVNPTNVMGATKRLCEMIVLSASTWGKVKYSATRFGNVLGSAGSVIPLFKRQIANGGPITLTDKRIIRYFMSIPEASQLVLHSGVLANNGELMVLDMGEPMLIYDLAKKLIEKSGVPDIEIKETGLRPGEKLYEELLVKTEELDKTENDMIFIERDTPVDQQQIWEMLEVLRVACAKDDDEAVRRALHQVLPTFKTPEEINNAKQPAVV